MTHTETPSDFGEFVGTCAARLLVDYRDPLAHVPFLYTIADGHISCQRFDEHENPKHEALYAFETLRQRRERALVALPLQRNYKIKVVAVDKGRRPFAVVDIWEEEKPGSGRCHLVMVEVIGMTVRDFLAALASGLRGEGISAPIDGSGHWLNDRGTELDDLLGS